MGKKDDKTNVMRILDQKKIEYIPHIYSEEMTEGVKIAEALGEDPMLVYKTLVTVSASGAHYVFVIPVAQTLDLKAAARAVQEKSVSMLLQKELLPLTGYIHGGCSPIGMKKPFPTVFDASAENLEKFFVSAGKVGRQIETDPKAVAKLINAKFYKIVKE